MSTIIGWDIGGAHLKAALLRNGRIEAVTQRACTLWLGIEHLAEGWRALVAEFGEPGRHAVTMTGELAEIFASRQDGVTAICLKTTELAGGAPVSFYASAHGFLGEAAALTHWSDVASANWHASARAVGRHFGDALFIDIGSTTTDIIAVTGSGPALNGTTDAERLETGELVYTGVTRTSLMAIADAAPFAGRRQRLMAENFATTADLYRLTGELAPEDDSYPASDGRSKDADDCRARIARMFGRDVQEGCGGVQDWDRAVQFFRECQLRRIGDAIAQVLSARHIAPNAPFVSAGAGHFLVAELARRFGRTARGFSDLVCAPGAMRRKAGVCAPAVAVALLAARPHP